MFTDRRDAGRQLADVVELQSQRVLSQGAPLVVGLPRGGVPVATEVARALDADLDVIVVRKLGVPSQPELAMGAIGEAGVRVLNDEIIAAAGVTPDELARVERAERAELDRRARRYRGDRRSLERRGRLVIIVDDGVATGATAAAACSVARAEGARHIVLAVPVAPPDWTRAMGTVADEYVAVHTPDPFFGVGQFYADFRPTTDAEVVEALERPSRDV